MATVESRGLDRDGKPVPASGRIAVNAKGTGSNKSVIVSMVPQVATKEPGGFSNFMGPAFVASRPSDVIAIPVPAGNYNVSGWSVTDRAVSADVTFRNRLQMEVPFQVRSGEATYIGRINAVTVYGKNILGMQVPGEALVIITDEFGKDLSRIVSEYPAIKRAGIRKSNVSELYRKDLQRIAETPSRFFGLFP